MTARVKSRVSGSRRTKALLKDIDAALAHEMRPGRRRRLEALSCVLRGATFRQAERATGLCVRSVAIWQTVLLRSGVSAVRADGRSSKRPWRECPPIDAGAARKLCAEIRVLMRSDRDLLKKRRLMAVEQILQGQPIEAAARQHLVKAKTARQWVAIARRKGTQALLGKPKPG